MTPPHSREQVRVRRPPDSALDRNGRPQPSQIRIAASTRQSLHTGWGRLRGDVANGFPHDPQVTPDFAITPERRQRSQQ